MNVTFVALRSLVFASGFLWLWAWAVRLLRPLDGVLGGPLPEWSRGAGLPVLAFAKSRKRRKHPAPFLVRYATGIRDRVRSMRWLFVFAALAAPLSAQLPAPNESGVSMGHVHLMVADPDEQKKLWVGVLGAEVTHTGSLEMLKLPGIFIVVGKARTPPAEGSEGSTVNHIGFLVKSYAEMKAKLTAAKLELTSDNANTKQLMVNFPDKVKVEFTEDAAIKVPIALHHIHNSSTDPEKLRAWYVKTFGAKPGTRGTFLAAMIPGGEVDFRKAQQPEAPTKGRSLDHIGFEVKNLEAFCQKLQADGITLDMAYRDVPQIGLKIAFLTDPDGTRIELTEGLAGH